MALQRPRLRPYIDTMRQNIADVLNLDLGQVSVKGKEDPVATYRALARSDEVEQEAPFVGREDELDRLITAFDAAVGDGSARLVTVIGSPGVGKSRLGAELGDRLAGRARTTERRVEREGTGTFDPIADLLKSAVELADGLATEEVTERLDWQGWVREHPWETVGAAFFVGFVLGARPYL